MSQQSSWSDQLLPWLEADREACPKEDLATFMHSRHRSLHSTAEQAMPANLRAKMEPEDVLQETYCVAVHDFFQFSGTTNGELAAWINCILRHTVSNFAKHLRTKKSKKVQGLPLVEVLAAGVSEPEGRDHTAEYYTLQHETNNHLTCAFFSLPERLELVFTLHYYFERSFDEIAEGLGISRSTVYRMWLAALAFLKSYLKLGATP